MGKAEMRRDIEYLAGNLTHRGASTKSERSAAEYIRDRLTLVTPDVEIDDFFAIESPWLLFASYYGEAVVVALLASWEPWLAFTYGCIVFLLYLAEFSGYRILGNLLPQYETQNVVARLHALRPERLIVITAHYDSPRDHFLRRPEVERWLRPAHILVVVSMVILLVCCVLRDVALFEDWSIRPDLIVQWSCLGVLIGAAFAVGSCELSNDYVRGASDNASGVAVMLELADRIQRAPVENSDIWFLATGSKETWLSGMRHFLRVHRLDKSNTYFINVDDVGQGDVFYTRAEGLLHTFKSDPELIKAAQAASRESTASPIVHRGLPTDAYLAYTRGYKAIGITARGGRTDFDVEGDRPGEIDYTTVEHTADFVEAVVRNLAGPPDTKTGGLQ
ncbi:MAG: Zn-dependent exopeptidase M28 [Candidatus Hydrogenedentes bacterium]|nr:Zn-dependent exopeptidase M28 [Candidatus Hydrogenedentota bacterium]